MSRKIDKFRSLLGNPLTVYNFLIKCEALLGNDVQVLAEATTFPTEKMRDITLHYQGETLKYPTVPDSSHTWSCTVVDSENGYAFSQIITSKAALWEQNEGKVHGLTGGLGVDLQVILRSIDDKEVFKTTLHNCYFSGADPVELSAADPTTAFKWKINISFDWIKDDLISAKDDAKSARR